MKHELRKVDTRPVVAFRPGRCLPEAFGTCYTSSAKLLYVFNSYCAALRLLHPEVFWLDSFFVIWFVAI
jgi:hypothetical protein